MIAVNLPATPLPSIMMSYPKNPDQSITRRAILKNLAIAPLVLRAAPVLGLSPSAGPSATVTVHAAEFSDFRLTPHYPSPSPLADVLRLVAPGADGYTTEKYAGE